MLRHVFVSVMLLTMLASAAQARIDGWWTEMPPATPPDLPDGRWQCAMAYDSESDVTIVFGGKCGDYSWTDDTWAYDHNTNAWTEMNPIDHPGAMMHHAMTYDAQSDRIILFGGENGGYWDKVWAYDFNTDTWAQMPQQEPRPCPRSRFALAYDAVSDRIIMFGGCDGSPSYDLDDTWAYDYETNGWEPMAPLNHPSQRQGHAMAYDEESDRAILLGGMRSGHPDIYYNETWAYDFESDTWERMNPESGGGVPPARHLHAMTYDTQSDRVILFGGTSGGCPPMDDTWAYDLNVDLWQQIAAPEPADPRHGHEMAYDSESDRVILFGGYDCTTYLDDTWALQIEPAVWPMFRRDVAHNALSPYVGAQTPDVKWCYPTGPPRYSSAAIAADGTIYVGSSDNHLYAIDPDGTLKWRYLTGHYVYSSPAIGAGGTVYVGSNDGYLYAIDDDGMLKWRHLTGGYVYSSPAIGAGGTIYVGAWDNYLYAINPDGTLKWRYPTGRPVFSSPAIGPDGTIYVGSTDRYLYAINPDGGLMWRYETGDTVHSSPAIAEDGTIYVGSNDGNLHAVNPDGTPKWRYEAGSIVESSPAVGAGGTIYVGAWDNHLYAINPDGTLKWRHETGGTVESSPAIGADGTIYVGSFDDYVYAINANGTLKWRYQTGDVVFSSPAIGADGTIYIGSYDHMLYAFGPARTALAPFVVLGEEGAWVREYTTVLNGDIGANVGSPGPYLDWTKSEVSIGQFVTLVDAESRVMGDSVWLKQGSQVYDVYYNELDGEGEVLGEEYTPLELPLVPAFPEVPDFSPGVEDIEVPRNGSLTLDPGSYGTLLVRRGSTVTLTGGAYDFEAWDVRDHVSIYCEGATEVRIAGRLDVDNDSYFGPAPYEPDLQAPDVVAYITGINGATGGVGAVPKAAKFGERDTIVANIYVPNGTLWIKARSSATGAFLGKWVRIGDGTTLEHSSGW